MDEYLADWDDRMDELNDNTSKQLTKLEKEFKKKIGIIKSNTKTEIKEMATEAQTIMRDAGWDETGQAIIQGMSDGVGTGETFINRMKEIATNAVKAVEEVLEIHSPSRVFARIGKFMDEGIVVGLTEYSDKVYEASENVGKDSISAMSSSISKIADIVDGDMNIEPTIAPVLDLTNVRNGMGFIDDIFGANRGMSLSSSIAMGNQNGRNSSSELFGKLQEVAEKSNDKLASAINSLRSDFNDMAAKLESMQVVLDGDALVGEMAPKMDNALGGLARMNRRGIR